MNCVYKSSQFNTLQKGKHATYLYNTFTTGLIALDEPHLEKIKHVLDNPSELAHLLPEERDHLINNGFVVPAEQDEFDLVKFRYRKGVYNSANISITLVPTKGCNLACSYCFEHHKTGQRIDQKDCEAILKFLETELTEIGPPEFMIHWYGGEPLLCLDVIEEIVPATRALCKKLKIRRNKDTMVTNGYLLDERKARKLKKLGIGSIQITLDGNRQDHDRTRVLKNGGGTFEVIRASIDIARAHFDNVSVRINTNKGNLPGVREMLLADPVFQEENVSIYIGPLKSYLGGQIAINEDKDCFSGTELQLIQQEIDELLKANQPPGKKNEVPSQFQISANNCGADQCKSFVIGPGCRVYKCYERLDEGEEVGTVAGGVFAPNVKYWKWMINEPFEIEACQRCLYLPICMGGCPSIRKRLGNPNNESCGYWQEWLRSKLEEIDAANGGE